MAKLTADTKWHMPDMFRGYNARDYDPAALYRHILSYKNRYLKGRLTEN